MKIRILAMMFFMKKFISILLLISISYLMLSYSYAIAFSFFDGSNNGEDQYQLGRKYEDGYDVYVNITKSIDLYKQAAEKGNPKAQFRLCELYIGETYIQIPKDTKLSDQLYVKSIQGLLESAEKGDAESQYLLGRAYRREGISQNAQKSTEWLQKAAIGLQKAANQGNAFAQLDLCFIEKDKHKSFELNKIAAEQKLAKAQHYLAMRYADKQQAIKWSHEAAEQGYVNAQMDLGMSYDTLYKNVLKYAEAKDDTLAAIWYQRCVDQGYRLACLPLALMYLDGRGVQKDQKKACALARVAAVIPELRDLAFMESALGACN